MFEDALNYPRQGEDWLTTVLIGGALQWLAVFVTLVSVLLMFVFVGFFTIWFALVPGVLIAGYTIAVARDVLDSEAEPPAFENWERLLVDGLKLALVGIVYSIPFVVFFALFLVAVAINGRAGAVVGVLFALIGFVYAIAIAYFLPISLVNLAREDAIVAAFDFSVLGEVAFTGDYAVGWLLAVAVKLLGGLVNGIIAATVVGGLVVPFVQFYTRVSGTYLITRGYMDARDIAFDPDPDGDAERERQITLDEASDDGSPPAVRDEDAAVAEDEPEHGPTESEHELDDTDDDTAERAGETDTSTDTPADADADRDERDR